MWLPLSSSKTESGHWEHAGTTGHPHIGSTGCKDKLVWPWLFLVGPRPFHIWMFCTSTWPRILSWKQNQYWMLFLASCRKLCQFYVEVYFFLFELCFGLRVRMPLSVEIWPRCFLGREVDILRTKLTWGHPKQTDTLNIFGYHSFPMLLLQKFLWIIGYHNPPQIQLCSHQCKLAHLVVVKLWARMALQSGFEATNPHLFHKIHTVFGRDLLVQLHGCWIGTSCFQG